MKLKNKQPLTEIVKVDLKDSKEVELKKIQRVFDEVQEEDIKDFFIDDSDIFDSDEISESDKKFILDLIDTTSFIADTKSFGIDTEAKMEFVGPAFKQEIEKKNRNLLMQTK